MAYNLNFGYQDPTNNNNLLDFGLSNYTPMQSNALGGIGSGLTSASPTDSSSLFGSFNSWLQGDTARSLFGGTDPSSGFQSSGIVSPVLSGLGSLFSAWNGMQSLDLAKQSLAFQQDAYGTNLANSQASYNTALEDRIRGRTSNYDGKEEDVQSYINRNKLGS